MDFMQAKENWNDSKSILMWGLSIAILWVLFNDPFLAVIPAFFMPFSDAITGVVRNALYKKRTKSPIGNIFMLIVCIVVGYFLQACLSTQFQYGESWLLLVRPLLKGSKLGP